MNERRQSSMELLASKLVNITNDADFYKAMTRVADAAFSAVFQAQAEGELTWKRAGSDLNRWVTKAEVKNGSGETITIPVTLYTTISPDYAFSPSYRSAYLVLGSPDERGREIVRNDADPRVIKLYKELSGKDFTVEV